MKKKIKSKIQFYGIIALFLLIVSLVEVLKTAEASKKYAQIFDKHHDSGSLIALPIFSIAIVLLLAIPRKNF